VDAVCRLSPPSLGRWGSQDVRLASLLHETLQALSPHAPPPAAMRLPSFFGGASQTDPAHPDDQRRGQQAGAAGGAPVDFPLLAEMPAHEMELALNDPATFGALLARVAASDSQARGGGGAAAARRETADLARANLAVARQLAELRTQIAIVRSAGADAAKAAFAEKFARQERAREQVAPERLIERLARGAAAAGDEAAALEGRLLGGALPVEAFLQDYVAARTRYHSRHLRYQAALQTIPTTTPVAPPHA
jgi:hypothetical protein